MKIQLFALLFGDYFPLHQRLLTSLKHAKRPELSLQLWGNVVVPQTIGLAEQLGYPLVKSPFNLPKYRAMRSLFDQYLQPDTDWVIWLDDDSALTAPDWYENTCAFIQQKQAERICLLGQKWYVHYREGQWEFTRQSPLYKGVPVELIENRPGVRFITGGYWWLKASVLRELAWPRVDLGLSHNGGDTLLSEAVRQLGYPVHHFEYGVKINKAGRRGLSECPLGCTSSSARV